MTKIRVYPYKQGSASAKILAEALDTKVLKLVGSKFKPRRGDVIINWGSGNVPAFGEATILNRDVTVAQCKLKTFEALKAADISIPPFVKTKDEARNLPFPVVCRSILRGHSGAGIHIADTPEQLVDAPLYTQYIKKKDEYRVHCTGEGAFFIQRKARKLDEENPNWKIRNLAGGFVFVEVEPNDVPAAVIDSAVDSINALNLDFGGVDVMWNEREGRAYVLEVNTACGLEERTAEKYKATILNLIEG